MKWGTYCEDDATDGGAGLGEAHLVLHVGLGLEGRVADAVVEVEAAKGHLIEIVQLNHCCFFAFVC